MFCFAQDNMVNALRNKPGRIFLEQKSRTVWYSKLRSVRVSPNQSVGHR